MYSIKSDKSGRIVSVSYNGRVVYYTSSINRALHFINKGVIDTLD